MTCLVAPPAFCADDNGDSDRQQILDRLGVAYQNLLNNWRGLGLNLDLFHEVSQALGRLQAWSPAQLDLLHADLEPLSADPALCCALAAELVRIAISGPSAQMPPAPLQRSLVLLRPLLSVKGLERCADGRALVWPSLNGDPLGVPLEHVELSLRVQNRLRRQGFRRLHDLVGLDLDQLLLIRGMGQQTTMEIAVLLACHGLNPPFTLENALTVPPQELAPVAPEPIAFSDPFMADPTTAGAADEEPVWLERAQALLGGGSAKPEHLLEDLQALTLEHFPELRSRLEEIHLLRDLMGAIAEAGQGAPGPVDGSLVAAVQQRVLQRYGLLLLEAKPATSWLVGAQQELLRNPEAMQLLLEHAGGGSLRAIGASRQPTISGERVRQKIQRLETRLGFRGLELAAACRDRRAWSDRRRRAAILESWITTHGRLPHQGDDPAHLPADKGIRALLREVAGLSLSRRLALHAELELPVPQSEWDLHFETLYAGEQRPGAGYWNELEPLKQFLPRFAELIGEPGRMPLQTTLPPAVKGAVQRHGGQSAVARVLGLRYQGQLVGASGRTYWTEERLALLLEQTVRHAGLGDRAMPTRRQIQSFFLSGLVEEYCDKQVGSVFAALTRQATLSWEQVAERFGRQ